ncbi:hypothetical protein D3C81_1842820 [compost metagenome]
MASRKWALFVLLTLLCLVLFKRDPEHRGKWLNHERISVLAPFVGKLVTFFLEQVFEQHVMPCSRINDQHLVAF